MAWISKVKVGLNTERKGLTMNGNEYKYDQLSISAPPYSSDLVTIYASEAPHIPAWGKGEVPIQAFNQGGTRRYKDATLPKTLAYWLESFAKRSIDRTFPLGNSTIKAAALL